MSENNDRNVLEIFTERGRNLLKIHIWDESSSINRQQIGIFQFVLNSRELELENEARAFS